MTTYTYHTLIPISRTLQNSTKFQLWPSFCLTLGIFISLQEKKSYPMKNIFKKSLMIALGAMILGGSSLYAQSFIKGTDKSNTYSFATDGKDGAKALNFTSKSIEFKALGFYNNNSVNISVENAKDGKRTLVVLDGKFNLQTSSGTSALPVGASDLASTDYEFAIHDFTDDGFPELIVGLRNKNTDEISIHILEYGGSAGWYSIGEMVSKGKKIDEARVFRQAVTFKSGAGVMYTWTFHDDHFSFLSSDHENDPEKLL